jgi:hypothetical protein
MVCAAYGPVAIASAPAVSPAGVFDALLSTSIPAAELPSAGRDQTVYDTAPTSRETAHGAVGRVDVELQVKTGALGNGTPNFPPARTDR